MSATAATAKKQKPLKRHPSKLKQASAYTILTLILISIVAVTFAFPLYWIITGSFKTGAAINSTTPEWWPHEWVLTNYQKLFAGKSAPLWQLAIPFSARFSADGDPIYFSVGPTAPAALRWMINTVFMAVVSMILTCITAAMAAFGVSALMGVEPTRFTVSMPRVTLELMLPVVVLSILCALVSILFCKGLHWTEHLLTRSFRNPWLRVLAGAAILIVLSLLTNGDYNGAGMDVIARALRGDISGWAWLWKLLFTAVTIGCGFKGGEVVPSFFVGAAFGCFMGGLLGLPAGFAAAIGLVAVFCGAVNCPVASVLLSVELFGSAGAPYFAVACALSYLLSGYCGLYSSQTILYSKLRAEFINVRTHE